ncbi:helix-turn-helix domain-containing protein [Bradyrhizobium sp. WSM 1738]|uniref:helix-turn-helix domain-containing protein n=1 Tax=Bradyrhizobium hereditatis TaxID=2821405 RepID=UPI001CE2D41D|nr:helix-turn-helix domain-containing protein [Bradyrhizobium hereditatis]MCA6115814.1 helix-turn-helix domain-containing protein [Bradyrhizobium hereditatis]
MSLPPPGRFGPCQSHRSWATLGELQPDLVEAMPISVSTDSILPTDRQAFWTEAICRSFANVETRPIGSAVVSGRFEFVEIGDAKLVRFDSSPQCYTRDARLVSRAGSDEFMFDFQRRGRSAMMQAGNEGTIDPGYGVLYDARRPFEDRLFGPEQRAEVLIATVPAVSLLRALPSAERLCARPVPLSSTMARAVAAFVHAAISVPSAPARRGEPDIVAYLSALLRVAAGADHQLARPDLFHLIDRYLKANLSNVRSAPTLAAEFSISERTFHRIFADRETTFERHVLHLRVELFKDLLRQASPANVSIAALAHQCGFADAAHATRTFKDRFGLTPRDFRTSAPEQGINQASQ